MVLRVTAGQRSQDGPQPPPPAPGPDGWVELTLAFRAPRAAVAAVAGFGEAIEVLGPPQVRDRMIATAQAVLDRYRG